MPALFNNDNRHRTYVGQGDFSMEMKINTGSGCKSCDDIITTNGSHCNSGLTVLVIRWNNVCVIALYFVEFVVLLAVFLCLMYFWRNKNSPLVKSCYSWPDNVTLAVLGLFCLLPVLHVGELSSERCMFLSPAVNVVFAFYTGLLSTKTLSVQNLLKCQTVAEKPARRMAFCVFVAILQVIVLATLPFSGFPSLVRFSCPLGPARAHEVVTLCDIQGNLSILGCMLYNWICLLLLSSISLFETFKRSRDLRRTGNLPAVAFVGLVSYTCLTTCAYLNLELENYMLVTLALYVVYLINPVVCLGALYIPTVCLISTCLHRQKNFQKKSKVMSPRRNSPAVDDSLFNYLVKSNFGPEHTSLSWSPYSSGVSHLSYPSSLVCGVRESVRVVSSFVASAEARSFERLRDNVSWTVIPRAEEYCKSSSPGQGISTPELYNESDGEYSDIEFTYQGQLKDWLSILNGLESSDV